MNRRDAFAVAILGLIGIGVPLWLAAAAGAIGLPTDDDWVYMRGAASLYRTGSVDMPGHTAASIGQLMMVQPLLWLSGGNPSAFTAFGLMMTLIGVVATYLLARRFVGTGSAVMVALLVLAFPGFARVTASFMTDVPAYALAVLCLLLGAMWLEGEGRRLTLVASLVAGLLAMSVREFAIAAPAAVLVTGWARNRAERVWLAGASGVFVAGVAGVLIAAASIPGQAVDPIQGGLVKVVLLGPAFTTFAAVLLPAVALGLGRRLASFTPEPLILGAGLVGLVLVMPSGSLVGNLWMTNGLIGDALLSGTRDPVIGVPAWGLSQQLALFAGALLAAFGFRWAQRNLAQVRSLPSALTLAVRIARRRDGVLVLFLVANAVELVVYAPIGGILDRYLFPMVPAAAILLLRGPAQPSPFRRSRAFAHAASGWLAACAFVIAANSFAYDAARHREGEVAVAMGYDARTVDAGYEWVGYHSSGVRKPGSGTHGLTWYDDVLLSTRPCAVLANSPLDDDTLRLIQVNRSAYRQYLFFGPAEPLYLYGAVTDGCPPLPAAFDATAP